MLQNVQTPIYAVTVTTTTVERWILMVLWMSPDLHLKYVRNMYVRNLYNESYS